MTTSEAARRLPWGLTLAVIPAMALLIGLGVWQVQRLHWKEGLIATVAAKSQSVPKSTDDLVVGDLEPGGEWTRVEARCTPPDPSDQSALIYTLKDGEVAWRLWSVCRLPEAGLALVVDRGFVDELTGVLEPQSVPVLPMGSVVGLLRVAPRSSDIGIDPAPIRGGLRFGGPTHLAIQQLLAKSDGLQATGVYSYLAAQWEAPAAPGLTPHAEPAALTNNHLGYAATWFGLALALAGFYAAMVARRMRP